MLRFIVCLFCGSLVFLNSSTVVAYETSDDPFSFEELMNAKISTATKYEKNISDIPASVTIITFDDIQKYGYSNLAEALNSVSGFYLSYDRNYHYLGTRGFSRPSDYNNRIKLMVDGVSLNDNYYGAIGLVDDFIIDFETVERIEIIKGPGSALYGTGAMFAVINVITKKVDILEGLQITGHAGTASDYRSSLIFNKRIAPHKQFSVSAIWGDRNSEDLYFSEFDDPASNNGVAESLDWSEYNAFKAMLALGDFKFNGAIVKSKKGVPTAPWEIDFNHSETKTIDDFSYIEGNYHHKFNSSLEFSLSSSYNYYYYKGYFPYDDFMTWDANTSYWYTTDAELDWKIHSKDRLNGGIEFHKSSQAEYSYWGEDGEIYYTGDNPYNIASLYLQNEYQVTNNLSFTTGLRYDNYSISDSYLSPRAALVYHPSQSTTLKMLYGHAFRTPSLYESYYEDPISDYYGNAELKPENITTYEFVLEHFLNNSTFTKLTIFNYELEDLIDYVENPIDFSFVTQNRDKVDAKGFEAEIRAQYYNEISWYANYTYETAEDGGNDLKLTNSPTHLFKGGVAYPLSSSVSIATDIRYESERKTVYDTYTDSYIISNLNIFIKPKLQNTNSFAQLLNQTKISFKVRNVFDTEYANPGGFEHYQDKIVQDGRSFRFTLSYLF